MDERAEEGVLTEGEEAMLREARSGKELLYLGGEDIEPGVLA